MTKHGSRQPRAGWMAAAALLFGMATLHAASPPARHCMRVELEGEVSAGQEWKAAFGQGWRFRVVPIVGHSGWDLVVDRDPPAGYPDALLLATPPYDSINEREIGTTFGLRAQDAVGWNVRSFHFLTNAAVFVKAQQWFLQIAPGGTKISGSRDEENRAMQRLLELRKGASNGQLRILDARLVPGTRDPQPFAQGWALAFPRTQHEIEQGPAGPASAEGRLAWMRFSIALWLPAGWRFAPGLHPAPVTCPE